MTLSPQQYETLSRPINARRVAKRQGGGKTLSYLESWDVRAHLIRVFGYTGFDVEVIEAALVFEGDYTVTNDKTGEIKDMVEVAWRARVRLTVRGPDHQELATYVEASVGSATGPRKYGSRGDLHDNAVKSAESDALKRCAINLGNQFGLSLYDNGSTRDVILGTLVKPEGLEAVSADMTDEQAETLRDSLGAEFVAEETPEQPEEAVPGNGEDPSPPAYKNVEDVQLPEPANQ